jgi:phytoene dehydrogenase-like protein
MEEKSIIIIGAGIAGLSAGIYAQMNGYKTQIFEMNIKPGGLCTAWERKGYIIDGCLHWLVGTSPDSSYNHMWKEVGVLQGKQVIDMDQYMRVETAEGKVITLYTDVDKLEKHLKEIAPEDSAFIDEFTRAIRRFAEFDIPSDKAPELYSTLDNLKMMTKMAPYMGEMQKWSKMTLKEFAERFQNPALREVWQMVWPVDFSSLFFLMTLGWMTKKNAGYVVGGSMEISLAMEKRYCELGGKINYRSGIEKILVENNRAVGIKLANGTEHKSDYVISAADGHATIWEMLEGKYLDDTVRGYYEMPIFQPLVYIGLGVNRSFADMPQMVSGMVFPLEKPIVIGNKEHKNLGIHIYNFDPSFAPSGKTVLTVMFESDFNYWAELSQDMKRYKAEKEIITVAVVSALSKRFPGIAKQIEMWDIATPLTFYRYTGNWQGSYEGWLMTPQNMNLRMKKTLPGLDNFYMVGQWVQPGGGLPSGLMTGCHVVQILCKRDKKKYAAALPAEQSVESQAK